MTIATIAALEATIDAAWHDRAALTPATTGAVRDAVTAALTMLDNGAVRVAEPGGGPADAAHTGDGNSDGNGERSGSWRVNQWLKKAVLLSFRLNDNQVMPGPGDSCWFDKVPSKFAGWGAEQFRVAGFRAVPGAIVRHGAHIGRDVVLMPSFVNIGARVGAGTMIDTWATVGSCAQIGANVHLSGGVGIGGVLEPLQAEPVVIEDDCFIGARSEVVEGVHVERGAVLAMGVFLSSTSKIIDRATGEIFVGRVPAYSVVVPGTLPGRALPDGSPGPNLACAVIVKRVDAQTRAKTAINELLRD